jgi:hypothetical protein
VPVVDGLDVEDVERERLPRLQPLRGPPQVPLVPDVAAGVGRIGRRVDLDVGAARASTASTSPRLKASIALRAMGTLRSGMAGRL